MPADGCCSCTTRQGRAVLRDTGHAEGPSVGMPPLHVKATLQHWTGGGSGGHGTVPLRTGPLSVTGRAGSWWVQHAAWWARVARHGVTEEQGVWVKRGKSPVEKQARASQGSIRGGGRGGGGLKEGVSHKALVVGSVIIGGRLGGCLKGGGGGVGWDPPPPMVPLMVPAEGGPKIGKLKSSWRPRAEAKFWLSASASNSGGEGGGGLGGGKGVQGGYPPSSYGAHPF